MLNIEKALSALLPVFNKRKPSSFAEITRKSFQACFVRAGQKKSSADSKPAGRCLLDYANDWKMLVDFEDKKLVFPPTICATNLRPDIVIWSLMSRVVILIELTCCAEEGIGAAQVRKETRYAELLDEINSSTSWKASLLTLEIGARGLVGSRTFRSFVNLGFSSSGARKLCRGLSAVAARCSYAIYLAHKDVVWHHKTDLICLDDVIDPPAAAAAVKPTPELKLVEVAAQSSVPNIVALQAHGFFVLYHFTDAANIESIRKTGLMSASDLESKAISSVMNSDKLSRDLDKSKGLENYVRLSLNANNPMKYVAQRQKRISKPVMLQIKLEVVSRTGVLFSDCNATRRDAITSNSPDIIRFDVVKAKSQFDVEKHLVHFYQAEVLVPSPLPPDLIIFPTESAATNVHPPAAATARPARLLESNSPPGRLKFAPGVATVNAMSSPRPKPSASRCRLKFSPAASVATVNAMSSPRLKPSVCRSVSKASPCRLPAAPVATVNAMGSPRPKPSVCRSKRKPLLESNLVPAVSVAPATAALLKSSVSYSKPKSVLMESKSPRGPKFAVAPPVCRLLPYQDVLPPR